MKNRPVVSVCCITYNHAKYIREALDGIIMQKTSFSYEIIIHDDASADGTKEILIEYQNKYPKIIRLILQHENVFSKGHRPFADYVFPAAKGQFLAICEGDDYWIDELKLQKQYDIMLRNPEAVMVFHNYYKKDKDGRLLKVVYPQKDMYELEDILRGMIISLHSCFIRKEWCDEVLPFIKYKEEHVYFIFLLSTKGSFIKIDEYMGVYRVHDNGAWSSADAYSRLISIHSGLDLMIKYLSDNRSGIKIIKYRKVKSSINYALRSIKKGDIGAFFLGNLIAIKVSYPLGIVRAYLSFFKKKLRM